MRFLFILALLLGGCSAVVYKTDEALTLRRMTSKSIIRILSERAGGSGFITLLGTRKVAVTNAHVCGEAPYHLIARSDQTGENYTITPIAVIRSVDLCVSDIVGAEALPPLKLANNNAEVGTTVHTLGYPLLRYLRLVTGQVELYRVFNNKPVFVTNMPVMPGQSGSPVVNSDYEVVGVIAMRDLEEPHTSYAIPVEMLNVLLRVLEEKLNKGGSSAGN